MDYYLLGEVATDLGYELSMSGAETFRVEESVTRVLQTYGIHSEVFAIPNCIQVSFKADNGKPLTLMRRIGNHGNDLWALRQYNALSRRICTEMPDPETAKKWLEDTRREKTFYSTPILLLGNAMAAGGFTLFFGGTLMDAFLACICGVVVGLSNTVTGKLKTNPFFSTVIGAFLLALISYAMEGFGLTYCADAIIIGTIMILVPGLLFTNAMRDIIYGDTISGVNRIVQAMLITIGITLGASAAWRLTALVWPHQDVPPLVYSGFVQCLTCIIDCFGFALLFNVRNLGVTLCAVGGTLSWAVYLISIELGCDPTMANFWAAFFASVYSEIVARIRKNPAISYLAISLFPMLPGAGIYYTMRSTLQGNVSQAVATGLNAAGVAGNLAAGVLLASTLFRIYANWQAKHRAIQ